MRVIYDGRREVFIVDGETLVIRDLHPAVKAFFWQRAIPMYAV